MWWRINKRIENLRDSRDNLSHFSAAFQLTSFSRTLFPSLSIRQLLFLVFKITKLTFPTFYDDCLFTRFFHIHLSLSHQSHSIRVFFFQSWEKFHYHEIKFLLQKMSVHVFQWNSHIKIKNRKKTSYSLYAIQKSIGAIDSDTLTFFSTPFFWATSDSFHILEPFGMDNFANIHLIRSKKKLSSPFRNLNK